MIEFNRDNLENILLLDLIILVFLRLHRGITVGTRKLEAGLENSNS